MFSFTFGLKAMAIAALVSGVAMFAAGWSVRDAFCDAATARALLEAEQSAHEATKTDLAAATIAANSANATLARIQVEANIREDMIRDLQNKPPAAADPGCKLGADGLNWLRRIAPD